MSKPSHPKLLCGSDLVQVPLGTGLLAHAGPSVGTGWEEGRLLAGVREERLTFSARASPARSCPQPRATSRRSGPPAPETTRGLPTLRWGLGGRGWPHAGAHTPARTAGPWSLRGGQPAPRKGASGQLSWKNALAAFLFASGGTSSDVFSFLSFLHFIFSVFQAPCSRTHAGPARVRCFYKDTARIYRGSREPLL